MRSSFSKYETKMYFSGIINFNSMVIQVSLDKIGEKHNIYRF